MWKGGESMGWRPGMWVITIATHHTLGFCRAHGPLFPSAWDGNVATAQIGMCLSAWALWGLESSLAGRTKAWLDIQAQNTRANVKKSDRQTDRHCSVYEQQGACLCPLWSWPSPPTRWPSGLGGTRQGAVTMARDQCVGRGHCPCLGTDLRIFGRGPYAPRS